MKNQDYLYLDHAASTPMRKSAMDKYIEAESFGFANSSGGHKLSRNSKNLLEDSREVISELFNSAPGEIIFTSGGTEADNWTIKSLFDSKITNSNLVTSNIEHEAVLASAEWVSSNGFQTKYAKSDENGFVTKDEFINQIDDETIVASLMWGNNETGVIQPIKDISKDEFLEKLKSVFELYEQKRDEGKIKFYGMATWECFRVKDNDPQHLSLEDIVQMAKKIGGDEHGFKFIQLPYNMNYDQALLGKNQIIQNKPVSILESAVTLGIGVFTSVPFMQGRLLTPGVMPEFSDLKSSLRALQFIRSSPGVLAPLVGQKSAEHVS